MQLIFVSAVNWKLNISAQKNRIVLCQIIYQKAIINSSFSISDELYKIGNLNQNPDCQETEKWYVMVQVLKFVKGLHSVTAVIYLRGSEVAGLLLTTDITAEQCQMQLNQPNVSLNLDGKKLSIYQIFLKKYLFNDFASKLY